MRWAGLLVLLALILGSCSGSRELTRGKAKQLIEESDTFKPRQAKVRLTEEEVKSGLKSGYWQEQQTFLGMFGSVLVLTPQGHALFAGFEPQIQGRILDIRDPATMEVLQVTGITDVDGPDQKQVDFMWNWNFRDSRPEVQQFFQNYPAQRGQAIFKLYDDGWRVEGVQFQ